jgi:hypothetical protein
MAQIVRAAMLLNVHTSHAHSLMAAVTWVVEAEGSQEEEN